MADCMSSRVLNSIILVSLALFMLRSGTPRMEAVTVTGAAFHAAQENPRSTVHCASSGHSMHSGFTHDDRDAAIARPLDPLDAGIPAILCATKQAYRSTGGYTGVSSSRASQTGTARPASNDSRGAGISIAFNADNPSRFHLRI
jgi:hypothetical protein